jgi:zinc transport system substrate-binding protein
MIFISFLFFLFSLNTSDLNIIVSVMPQKGIVDKISGVNSSVLIRPGYSPHTYEITPSQIKEVSKANMFFKMGMIFDDKLEDKITSSNKKIKIFNMTNGIKLRESGCGNIHHNSNDMHVWMSVKNNIIMAYNVYKALSEIMPEKKDEFKKNLDSFIERSEKIDTKVKKILSEFKGRKFFVVHPSLGYFADEYGLIQIAIEHEGKIPTASNLEKIIKEFKESKSSTLFVQKEFKDKSIKNVTTHLKAKTKIIDVLNEDSLKTIERFSLELKKSF